MSHTAVTILSTLRLLLARTTPGPQRSRAESRRLLLARDYSWPVTPVYANIVSYLPVFKSSFCNSFHFLLADLLRSMFMQQRTIATLRIGESRASLQPLFHVWADAVYDRYIRVTMTTAVPCTVITAVVYDYIPNVTSPSISPAQKGDPFWYGIWQTLKADVIVYP